MQRNAVLILWDGVGFGQFFQHRWHSSEMIFTLLFSCGIERSLNKTKKIKPTRSSRQDCLIKESFWVHNSPIHKTATGSRLQIIAFEFAVQIDNAPPSTEKEAKHVQCTLYIHSQVPQPSRCSQVRRGPYLRSSLQ